MNCQGCMVPRFSLKKDASGGEIVSPLPPGHPVIDNPPRRELI